MSEVYDNARKPVGEGGKETLERMNRSHAGMAKWGFEHISPSADSNVLDAGCGGGANLKTWTELCPNGKINGIDYSEVSVKLSSETNSEAVSSGLCSIRLGSVDDMPYSDGSFDYVSAFETVYFWPDIDRAFKEVLRVLKDGGVFMICNETDGTVAEHQKWIDRIKYMKIYNKDELEALLRKAGFKDVKTYGCEEHWLCVLAVK